MNLMVRIQGIILKPAEEWPKIKGEPVSSIAELYKSYIMIVAAIPAIAQFLGFWLIGISLPFRGFVRFSLAGALGRALVSYVFSLVMVYVLALIVDALAPTFSSQPNQINALKLVAYSMTPYFVAGILNIIPVLNLVIFLAGLWGINILYIGLKQGIMSTPPNRVVGYLIIIIIVGLVLWLAVSLILAAIFSLSIFYGGL